LRTHIRIGQAAFAIWHPFGYSAAVLIPSRLLWKAKMHEMSIVMNILDQVGEMVRGLRPGASGIRVSRILVHVGKMTSVLPEALEFAFKIISEGTIFEGGKIEVKEIPAAGTCCDCGSSLAFENPIFICPRCQSHRILITSGRELIIESFELEEDTIETEGDNDGSKGIEKYSSC